MGEMKEEIKMGESSKENCHRTYKNRITKEWKKVESIHIRDLNEEQKLCKERVTGYTRDIQSKTTKESSKQGINGGTGK